MRQGWEIKPLGEICTLQRGFDLPKNSRTEGRYPLVSSGGVTDTHSESMVRGPGVATGRSGSIGSVFYINGDFWPLNTVLYVKDFHGNDPRFIYYLLMYFDLSKYAGGMGVPTLNRNNVHDLPAIVPNSILEQKRIVAILDEAFAGLASATANAEKNRRNARELFTSYLNSAFTQRVEDWSKSPIGEIATKIGSGATPTGGENSYKQTGIPLIRSLNVHDRSFKFGELAYLDNMQAKKLDNVNVQINDVLLNITGASVARCCVVPDSVLPARVNQHVSIIRPVQTIVSSRFLEFGLTAKINKDRLLGVGESAGATRQAITKAQIQEFVFSYPSLTEQQRLIERLDRLAVETDSLVKRQHQKLRSLEELKQSILKNAFSGELTSPPTIAINEAAE